MICFRSRFCLFALAVALLNAGCLTFLEQPAPKMTEAQRAALTPEQLMEVEIETKSFSELWHGMDELVTEYEDVLSGEDKSWFGRRTKKLTGAAMKLIASKSGIESYEKILNLQELIAKKTKEKDELVAGRLGYPVSSSNPFAMTREKCDQKIQELADDVKEANLTIDRQRAILLADLNRHGQVMDDKHLNYLLTAAGGDDVMQMMNLAIILRQVQYAIGKQIKSSPHYNGAQLQRYVGIQLVLLLAYQQAHTIGMENIQEKYLPRLAEIQKRAEDNLRETKALQSASQEEDGYLAQNLKLNENTIQIAKQYRTALQEMAASLEKSRSKVERNVAVTRNTFKTVTTGASLLQLIQESSQDYSELIRFNPPILDTIYSDQMMEAFQQVSAQLKN